MARRPQLNTISSRKWAAKFFPILKVVGDETVRAPVALNKAVCVIGRRLGVHLPLNSTKVSKVHALIVRQAGGVYVRDLASRNHLYVNDEQVAEAELKDGDAVRVGPFTLQCASGFGGEDGAAEETGPGVAPGAPRASLEVIGEETRVPLGARTALIGNRDDCELALADDRVAPVHAVVFELDGKHVLRDLNSSAGTFVNNELIHQEELSPGDEIRIGRVRVKYAVEGMPEADGEEAPASQPIDLAELDDDLPISVDAEEVEDPVDHPLTTPVVALPALEDLVELEEVSVPGVIDAGVSAVTVEPLCPEEKESSPDVASIPLPTRGGLEWSQEDRPAPLQPLPGAEPGFEEGAGDPDRPADAVAERGEPGEPARKLDQIVAELSDKVAELKTTWREVKEE